MCIPTCLLTMQFQSCTKQNVIYYFLYTALFLINHVLTQERHSREAYFHGAQSYALLPSSLSLNNPITFSFRTCSFGELLSQEGKNGDYLKIELTELGNLRLNWKVNNIDDTFQYTSSSLKNNLWHNLELRESSNSLLLKIDQQNTIIVSNSSSRTNLLSANLNNDVPNLYIGKNFNGCILEGSSIVLSDSRVRVHNVSWGKCPLPDSRNCDGYEIDACFSQPCQHSSICLTTQSTYKCQCTNRYSGENCEIDEGPLCSRPEFDLCQNEGECVEDNARNSTYCVCKPNFAGFYCETPSNGSVCDQNTCNGGTCIAHHDNGNSFKCICPPGFAGDNCSLNIDECQSNPCLNNGTCYDEIGSYFCHCGGTGYKGQNCQENINECVEQNPCSTGSTCFDNYGSYVCVCPPGKGGKDCDVPLDGCTTQPCLNGGTCMADTNGFDCRCPLGFEGHTCEVNVDDCAIAMCPPNSHCVDGINRYVCDCDDGFSGNPPNCSPLLSRIIESPSPICHTSSCFNGGTCLTEPGKNTTTCVCAAGFTGHLCETRCDILCTESGSCSPCNVDACSSNPCVNKRACRTLSNHSYVCDCLPGWTGRNCEIISVRASRLEDCDSQPCVHGVCSNHRCICDAGYTGSECETKILPCDPTPCVNGGTCYEQTSSSYNCFCPPGFTGSNCEDDIDDCVGVTCPEHQICHDSLNGHHCGCASGFTGSDCLTMVNMCIDQPCNQGTCLNGIGKYTCLCPAGITGKHCETQVSPCDSSPCQNGICQSFNGTFRCYCQPGYTGHICHLDIDECLSNPCRNSGKCQNLENDYKCNCAPGFEGKECEIDIDECASAPCVNGATCYDSINQYTCACVPGFTGINCETNINECDSNPCFEAEGVVCEDKINNFTCNCGDSGFAGEYCEKNIDDCLSDPCVNGGSCEDRVKEYKCHCYDGYQGVNCEIDVNECEISPCQNGATCYERSNKSYYDVNYLGKFTSFDYRNASGYICECLLGFNGQNCSVNIDDCERHDCVNGTCIDGINSYRCECIAGFEGTNCSVDINECERLQRCRNNATCNDLVNDYSCECHLGYGGKDCEIELLGCRNNPCANEGKCTPFLDEFGEHQFKCECQVGFTGRTCELVTIVSFKNGTWMDVNHIIRMNSYYFSYNVKFQFRTTLSNGILVHSADSIDNLFFVLYLRDGSVNLAIQNHGVLKNIKEDDRAPSRNDGLWKDVSISITGNSANLSVSNWIQTESVSTENIGDLRNTIFGGGPLPTSFATHQTFIGCIREIHFDDQLIIPDNSTLRGAAIGCDRKEQCMENTCSKIGRCQDYWFSYDCVCPRPFYGATCQNSVTPATFGHQDYESWAKIVVPEVEKQQLSQSVNVTLFLRTRKLDGFLFYLGPNQVGENLDNQYIGAGQATGSSGFIAVVLENGYLKALTGSSTGTVEVILMEKKLNDGYYHFVKVYRNATLLSLSINETTNHETVPEYPVKADVIYIGGIPRNVGDFSRTRRQVDSEVKNNPAVYNTHTWENVTFFKGIIQDFRINDKLIEMYPLNLFNEDKNAPKVFPAVIQMNRVSKGVVSDDPCNSNPCENDGVCVDDWNKYSCVCSKGYRGTNCTEREPCSIHQCPDKSVCGNLPFGYECVAQAALKGDTELKYKPSFKSNVTSNRISLKFRTQRIGGTLIHIVANGFNQNNHLTITINDSVIIQWKFGYEENIGILLVGTNVTDGEWHNVEIYVNDSILKAVMDNTERYAEYTSEISLLEIVQDADFYVGGNTKPDGYFTGCLDDIRIGEILLPFFTRDKLQNDESPDHFQLVSGEQGLHIGCVVCWDDFCLHGGACQNETQDFNCACPAQYTGQFCQEDTDECLDSPCIFGSCENLPGTYKCNCVQYYSGTHCEKEIDYCESAPCKHGAYCQRSHGNYTCECGHEYTGRNCQYMKVERCENQPCQHRGICTPIPRVGDKEFKCNCRDGYTGEKCETIIDYCSLDDQPCLNGSCLNTPEVPEQNYMCSCNLGFEGERCDKEVDPCHPNPCLNGLCQKEGLVNYNCTCNVGFEGRNCDYDIDECQRYGPCKNNGNCTNLEGSYECDCPELFAPPHCIVPNPCLNHSCWNDGECVTQTNEELFISLSSCKCAPGFNGTHCEEKLIINTTDTLALAVGLSLAVICAICIIVAVVIFLRIAKKKRATRGTYSPSRQEMFGSRVEMNHVMKPPPEERLI